MQNVKINPPPSFELMGLLCLPDQSRFLAHKKDKMQCQTQQHANIESCLKRSSVVSPAVTHEDLGIACVAVFQV